MPRLKKNDPSRLWIERGRAPMPVFIALCLSVEQFDQALSHIKVPMRNRPEFCGPNVKGSTYWYDHPEDEHSCAIVCVLPEEDPVQVVGTLIHEAVHIWQHVESYTGKMGCFGTEGEAYHIGWISETLIRAYPLRQAEL